LDQHATRLLRQNAQPGAAGDLAMLRRKLIKMRFEIPGKMVLENSLAKRLSAKPLGGNQ